MMTTPSKLVTVATFQTLREASVARGALEAAGIPAVVPSENSVVGLNHAEAQMIWAELQVRAVDREGATELLRQAGHR
jgi:hypothetical protein